MIFDGLLHLLDLVPLALSQVGAGDDAVSSHYKAVENPCEPWYECFPTSCVILSVELIVDNSSLC